MPREGDNKCIACARRRSWGLRPTDIKPHRGSKEEPPKEESQKDATKDSSDEDDKPVDDRFYATWDKFTKKRPSIKSTSTIKNLDHDLDGKHKRAPGRNPNGLASRQNAATSFEEAAETCRRKVRAIVDECKRLNKKYHDPMFDLRGNNSLVSLTGWVHEQYDISAYRLKGGVADVKRVGDIFDKPHFFKDGADANSVRQGQTGDCWFIASVTALVGVPDRIERICVDRDEQVGVYGFCFHRDGEWVSEVVDDRLCVRFNEDLQQYLLNVYPENVEKKEDLPKEFRKSLLKGPDSLYFASCRTVDGVDETWLPLLEKAYAKAHLSYQCIEGGWTGEGIEDLTGGINTSISSEDVLNKDRLWSELEEVNKQFLFGCGSRAPLGDNDSDVEGVVRSHAYTVLSARTIEHKVKDKIEKVRLLRMRNPWGNTEWSGAWSDGSKEWTPDTMKELDHTFGDDGIFWISFEDFLKTYPCIDRTRLFGSEWTIVQQWTTMSVPRTTNFLDTEYLPQKFTLHFTKGGPAVILLSQPDSRYFKALRGRYTYGLHFRIYKDGQDDYIVRSMSSTASGRSCSAEFDCEAGNYTVVVKLTPYRDDSKKTAAEIIKNFDTYGKEKVLEVGKMFDLAHARGRLREAEAAELKKSKEESRRKKRVAQKATRKLDREKRRKQKLQQQRIAKKEKQKEERSKGKQSENEAGKDSNDSAGQDERSSPAKKPDQEGKSKQGEENIQEKKSEQVDREPVAEENTASGQGQSKTAKLTNSQGLDVSVRAEDSNDKTASLGQVNQKIATVSIAKKGEAQENEESTAEKFVDVDNLSDVGSVKDEDFSWDSDIDGSVDEDRPDFNPEEEEEDLYGDDSWFALATIGMRVYSKDPDAYVEM